MQILMQTRKQPVRGSVRPIAMLVVIGMLILVGCAAGGSAQPAGDATEVPASGPLETVQVSLPTSGTVSNNAQSSPVSDPGTRSPDSSSPALPSADVITGTAHIETITINTLESMPVQMTVVAQGHLPDGCTQIDTVSTEFDEEHATFNVTLTTTRPADAMCIAVLASFEESVVLPVHGLAAGTYTVNVNNVSDTFTLAQDNVLP